MRYSIHRHVSSASRKSVQTVQIGQVVAGVWQSIAERVTKFFTERAGPRRHVGL
jgi:hypothetical protein